MIINKNDKKNTSSSLREKTTTKRLSTLLNKPELFYWQQKELQSKQVVEWMSLVKCDEKTMFCYLCYCKFDMVDLNLEESKPIKNVFNWFYKILKTTGGYPKPKGYKSFEEKLLEEERKKMKGQKRIAEERRKIFEEKQQAEFETKYWDMMNNPESEIYKICFSKINTMAKKLWNKKGNKSLSFQAEMKKELEKLLQEDVNR